MRDWTKVRAVLVAVALMVAATNGAMVVAFRGKVAVAKVTVSVA